MKRLKVIHIITRLELGGAQQNTLYTISHLDPSRFECLLVSGSGGILDSEARDMAASIGIRVRFVPPLKRELGFWQDLRAFLQLIRILREERPDIVHTHSSKAGILGRLSAFFCRVPIIVHTYHGFGFNDTQPFWLKKAYILAERFCAHCAAALVFVSAANENRARVLGIGKPAQYRLIRSGVKLADYPRVIADRAAKKASLGVGRHKLLVVSIGNCKPQKNPGDFVAVAEKVLAEIPETEFIYIGDGPLRQALEARVLARGLSSRLKFAGWRRDTAEILAVSDIFIMTSLWEGLPRALVEALKSGVPAVSYATDGIVDVLREGLNGFLISPGDMPAFSAKVLLLLKDAELRRRLAKNAALSIGPEFDIDAMVKSQQELYEGLSAKISLGEKS